MTGHPLVIADTERVPNVLTGTWNLIEHLRRLLRRSGGQPPAQRLHELGFDPAVGRFRPSEAETALRIENERGVTLRRAPAGSSADWLDESGKTYDAVGNFAARYFPRQWPQLRYQIVRHLSKAELVPVDVSKFAPRQVAQVEQFIADRGLAPRVFLVGQ